MLNTPYYSIDPPSSRPLGNKNETKKRPELNHTEIKSDRTERNRIEPNPTESNRYEPNRKKTTRDGFVPPNSQAWFPVSLSVCRCHNLWDGFKESVEAFVWGVRGGVYSCQAWPGEIGQEQKKKLRCCAGGKLKNYQRYNRTCCCLELSIAASPCICRETEYCPNDNKA